MSTDGLMSTRTTFRTRFLLFLWTRWCSRLWHSISPPSAVVKTNWSAGSCLDLTLSHPSGATSSFSSSIAGWMMISRWDLTTSTGSNSGDLEPSLRLPLWIPHLCNNAHSSFCSKGQILSERDANSSTFSLRTCGLDNQLYKANLMFLCAQIILSSLSN